MFSMILDIGMQDYSKEIRIAFFSLVASLFLFSWMNPGFSQEPLPEISVKIKNYQVFLESTQSLYIE